MLHVVITRFNIGLYDKYSIKEADTWTRHRVQLFERFCLPSIVNQTNKNFIWTVLFDSRTPLKWKRQFDRYKTCKMFYPIFAGTNARYQIIKMSRSKENNILVTTRYDNDDALSIHAIDTIQKNIPDKTETFINLSKGYVYDARYRKLYEFQSRANAFITAIENIKKAKTILGYGNHAKLKETHVDKITNIEDGRYWIQVIHDRNIMNKARGNVIDTAPLDSFKVGL